MIRPPREGRPGGMARKVALWVLFAAGGGLRGGAGPGLRPHGVPAAPAGPGHPERPGAPGGGHRGRPPGGRGGGGAGAGGLPLGAESEAPRGVPSPGPDPGGQPPPLRFLRGLLPRRPGEALGALPVPPGGGPDLPGPVGAGVRLPVPSLVPDPPGPEPARLERTLLRRGGRRRPHGHLRGALPGRPGALRRGGHRGRDPGVALGPAAFPSPARGRGGVSPVRPRPPVGRLGPPGVPGPSAPGARRERGAPSPDAGPGGGHPGGPGPPDRRARAGDLRSPAHQRLVPGGVRPSQRPGGAAGAAAPAAGPGGPGGGAAPGGGGAAGGPVRGPAGGAAGGGGAGAGPGAPAGADAGVCRGRRARPAGPGPGIRPKGPAALPGGAAAGSGGPVPDPHGDGPGRPDPEGAFALLLPPGGGVRRLGGAGGGPGGGGGSVRRLPGRPGLPLPGHGGCVGQGDPCGALHGGGAHRGLRAGARQPLPRPDPGAPQRAVLRGRRYGHVRHPLPGPGGPGGASMRLRLRRAPRSPAGWTGPGR